MVSHQLVTLSFLVVFQVVSYAGAFSGAILLASAPLSSSINLLAASAAYILDHR